MGYLTGGQDPYRMWASGGHSGLGIGTSVSPTRFVDPHTGREGYFYDDEKEALKERVFIAERARREAERLLKKPNSLENIKPIGTNKNKKLLLI